MYSIRGRKAVDPLGGLPETSCCDSILNSTDRPTPG